MSFKFSTFIVTISAFWALSASAETFTSLDIWRDSAKALDNFKVSYEMNSMPTQEAVSAIKTHPPKEDARPALITIFSKYHTLMDITRKGSQWKFCTKTEVSSFDIDNNAKNGEAFGRATVMTDNVETHSGDGLFYLDKIHHNGAFRAEWPDSPETPISIVLLPIETNLIAQANAGDEFIAVKDGTGRSLKRYYLDPKFGMMPKEIRCFDLLPDGSLFLTRSIIIEKYLETKQGAYIPEEGVIRDFPSGNDKNINWSVENRFHLAKFEAGIDIPDSDFLIKFPPGTHLTDYTINVDYLIPNNGENPVLSIANSKSN